MERFTADNIFALPLVLEPGTATAGESVDGIRVELSNGDDIVSAKTLFLYQDGSIIGSHNQQEQPLVRFLYEVDSNNGAHIENRTNSNQTDGSIVEVGATESLDLNGSVDCDVRLSNGDLSQDGAVARRPCCGEMDHQAACCDRTSCGDRSGSLLDSLDSLVQTIVLFQCRLCHNTSQDKTDIIRHLKSYHLINNTQKERMVILDGERKWSEGVDARREKSDDDRSTETQTVYMCGKCSLPFETMTECKTHMANHPKGKSGSKVNGRGTKKENNQMKSSQLETSNGDGEWLVDSGELDSNSAPGNGRPSSEELLEGKDCPDIFKEKNFKCRWEGCDLKFSTEDLMSLHAECHRERQQDISDDTDQSSGDGVQSPPYKCCRCHYLFNKWSELALHLWKSHHIDLDLYNCSVCTFKSVSRLELRRHFRNHAVGDFYCTACGKSFVKEALFRKHVSTVHSPNPPSESKKKKTKKKVEECGECGVKLSSAKALKKHVKVVHGKLRPYVCQVCPFTSSTLATLQLHLRQHTGETPFTCDICPFKTRDHNTMRRHRMRHTIYRPYSCKHCQFSCVQSTQFKNHMLKFHPESSDVFVCPDCAFTTVSESLIHSHRKVHHRGGRANKISDEVDRDRNLSSMFPSSKSKESKSGKTDMEVDDEESSSQCYFDSEQHIDTGGITIPAEETVKTDVKVNCSGESQLNNPGGGVRTGDVLVPNEDTMPLS